MVDQAFGFEHASSYFLFRLNAVTVQHQSEDCTVIVGHGFQD